MRTKFFLLIIIALGAFFRFYGLNWDQGLHLHPDERAIIMFTTSLDFPKTISEFFSPNSPWNPHFFAYGSFPLYLLKLIGGSLGIFNPLLAQYSHINLVGRALSAIFDLGILVLIFLIGKKLFNNNVGLLAAFFYAISVLPIQLSHFYAVDTPLSFFVLLTLYALVRFYERPTKIRAILVGIFFGLSLAAKISASVLVIAIGMAIAIDFLLLFLKNPHRPHIWIAHLPAFVKRLILDGVLILIATTITFAIVEPYAFIDFQTFWLHSMQQRQMTYDPFTFPYTLQYVGKTPYLYELKNIFLWGQGPILATLSFLGTLYVNFRLIKHLGWWQADPKRWQRGSHDSSEVDKKWAQELILTTFFFAYFLVIGNFAIGFMRYLLPLYPLLSLFGAVFLYRFLSSRTRFGILLMALIEISLLIWPLMFIHIYSRPNTRVLASQWINKNIPSGSTLAIEHWDDALPLFGQEKYQILTLPLYDPDTEEKWTMINQKLSQTDYIILASNRLYTPLMKLTDCQRLPIGRCYTQTANYYKKLFDGSLSFKKISEFSVYPALAISKAWPFGLRNLKLEIDDSSADESFSVYDHPKIGIFKKIETQ